MSIVSLYPHIKEVKKGENIPMSKIIEDMRAGIWKDKIDALRAVVASEANEKEISEIKNSLPYFTASGSFSIRNDKGLIQHSGKLAIDFDKVKDHEAARSALVGDKYSEYVFLSCTGRGYCVIVNIDPAKHLESFIYLEKYYKDVYGLTLDKGCKDISRPRFISYDDNLFHNPEYNFVHIEYDGPDYGNGITIESDEEKFEWVKRVHDKKERYEEGNRHFYLVVMAYFLNHAGVDQQYALQRYLSDYPDKDEKEIRRIIKDCYANHLVHGKFAINKDIKDMPPEYAAATKRIFIHAHGMNDAGNMWTEFDIDTLTKQNYQYNLTLDVVRNIFKSVFEKNKDSFGIDKKGEIFRVELFIKKRYEILKNEVNKELEYKIKGSPSELATLNIDNLNRDIMHAGFKFTLDKIKSLVRSDFVLKYNPFTKYFESLPAWDEKEEIDYIDKLASYVETDNQDFWRTQFKKALVRSLACSLDYKENRIIPTLIGENQETGKSNFIRFLCPPALKPYYTETMLDTKNKDSDMQLSQNFMWNLEELSSQHNGDINKLKAVISKAIVKQRDHYAISHESNPRRVNFWATTNRREFLTDDQNTRWLCFCVLHINHNYNNWKTKVSEVNIDNVWAQAYTLYKNGFDYSLTKEESETRDSINKEHEQSSTEKELISKYFKHGTNEDSKSIFVTNTDILIRLQGMTDNKIKIRDFMIGKCMRQLDFPAAYGKINGKTSRGWLVVQLDQVNSTSSTINFDSTPQPIKDSKDETATGKPF